MSDLHHENNLDNIIKFSKDSVLMVEGEASSYLYLIKSGVVRTVKEEGHRLIPVGIVRGRGFIGELSIFGDDVRTISAIAVEDSEVYMIKKSDIRKVLHDCPEWVTSIMVTISDRLKSSVDMLIEHGIVDDFYEQNLELTIQQEKKFKAVLEDFRERRGLKS